MASPRLVFVLSPYQNAFFPELVEVLIAALRDAGTAATVTTEPGGHEVEDDDVFVLTPPHEYVALEGDGFIAEPSVAARTIGLSAEQPHQGFFTRNAAVGARLGAVLDFSALAVDAYRRNGVAARLLEFGYAPAWDRTVDGGRAGPIEVPVLYLGNKRPRRLAALASIADALVDLGARLVVSDNDEPNRSTTASFLAGDDKRDLLARTGLLLNIHQSEEPYFEWLRFAEAAHCATPVLSEWSRSTDPFVDGEHFLSFEPGHLGERVRAVLADERTAECGRAAYELLRTRPLTATIGVLAGAAEELLAAPPPRRLPPRTRDAPIGRARLADWPLRAPGGIERARVRLDRATAGGWELVAPPDTQLARPIEEIAGDAAEPFVAVAAHGEGADGPMLEGFWPWEPWRLRYGQHLGRVLITRAWFLRAARRFADRQCPILPDHLAVEAYAAVRGVAGAHRSAPLAQLAVPVDPTHTIDDPAATCIQDLLR